MNMENANSPWMGARIPFIPLPMAVVGMMLSFVFGAMAGKMMAHRRDMMMGQGYGGAMMHGGHGKMMGHHGWKAHHHHAAGAAPCCCESGSEWPTAETPADLE